MQHLNPAAFMGAQPVPGSLGPLPGQQSQAADPANLSHLDLSSHLGPVAGKGGVYAQFFHQRVLIQNEGELDRYADRLCIAKQVAGDRATCAVTFIDPAIAAREFPREWAQFQATGLVATTGTPLHELPGITMSQVGLLVLYHVRSIEDLVSIGRDRAQQLGLEIAAAFDLASSWLKRADAERPLIQAAEEKAVREAALAKSEERASALEAQLAATNAKLEAFMAMAQGGQLGAMVPQGLSAAGPVTSSAPIMVEGERVTRRENVQDAFDEGTGGTVSGNDDLGLDTTPAAALPPDPIAPTRGRKG